MYCILLVLNNTYTCSSSEFAKGRNEWAFLLKLATISCIFHCFILWKKNSNVYEMKQCKLCKVQKNQPENANLNTEIRIMRWIVQAPTCNSMFIVSKIINTDFALHCQFRDVNDNLWLNHFVYCHWKGLKILHLF